jgi:hypothetical protein
MKRLVLTVLMIYLSFGITQNSVAAEVARVKDLAITELKDSIEVNLTSDKTVSYQVVKYMNGEVGIKLNDASISPDMIAPNALKINQKYDINNARIQSDLAGDIEIKLSGSARLADKDININNQIAKSNIIIIEPEVEDRVRGIIPLTVDAPDVPVIQDFVSDSISPTRLKIQPQDNADVQSPISMFYSKNEPVLKGEGKKYIAQAESLEEDLLEFSKEPLSTAPTGSNTEEDIITSSTSSSEVPEDQTRDALNPDNIEDPDVTSPEKDGFLNKTGDFLWQYKWWVGGVSCCGIIGFIIVIMGLIGLGQSRAPEGMVDPESGEPVNVMDPEQTPPITDNEPVNYIPPTQSQDSQSVSDAISKIIFLRNKPK